MRNGVIILLIFVFNACSSRPVPREVLLPEQMQKIVLDLIKADEFINGFVVRDTTVNIKIKRSMLYAQVFTIHHTSREEFYKSYQYYQQHPDKHKIFFDSLYAEVNRPKEIAKPPKMIKPMNLTKPPRNHE